MAGVLFHGRTPGTRSGSRPNKADKNSWSWSTVEMSPHIDQFNSVLHADNYRRWNHPKLFFKEGAWERAPPAQAYICPAERSAAAACR